MAIPAGMMVPRRGGQSRVAGGHVFGNHAFDQSHRQALLSRRPILARREPLRLGVSRPHRESRARDGAAAPAPRVHHRRHGPPAERARSRRRRRAPGTEYRRILRVYQRHALEHAIGHHGRQLRDGDQGRGKFRGRHPGLFARQPASIGKAQLTSSACAPYTRKTSMQLKSKNPGKIAVLRTRPSREAAEEAVRVLIEWAGDDPKREGLKNTPGRVARAFEEYFSGYDTDPVELLGRTFKETDGYDEMVVLKDIRFESHCEHHMAPIIGKAHIAYLPEKRVIGISKLARLVEVFARRLQIQEKMTAQIANTLDDVLKPKGVAVVIETAHQCMTTRGVHKAGVAMVTSRMLGAFRDDPSTRREFLAIIGQPTGGAVVNV